MATKTLAETAPSRALVVIAVSMILGTLLAAISTLTAQLIPWQGATTLCLILVIGWLCLGRHLHDLAADVRTARRPLYNSTTYGPAERAAVTWWLWYHHGGYLSYTLGIQLTLLFIAPLLGGALVWASVVLWVVFLIQTFIFQ